MATDRRRTTTTLTIIGLLIIAAYGFWTLHQPSNRAECYLKNLNGTSSDMAARVVVNACNKMFAK